MAGAGGGGIRGGGDDLRGASGSGPGCGVVSALPGSWAAERGGADGTYSPGAGGVFGGGICRGLLRGAGCLDARGPAEGNPGYPEPRGHSLRGKFPDDGGGPGPLLPGLYIRPGILSPRGCRRPGAGHGENTGYGPNVCGIHLRLHRKAQRGGGVSPGGDGLY